MHVLVEKGLKPVSRLIVWRLAGIVNPSIVAYATHICSKNVQCEVVILLLQTLLHEGQVHWVLQQASTTLVKRVKGAARIRSMYKRKDAAGLLHKAITTCSHEPLSVNTCQQMCSCPALHGLGSAPSLHAHEYSRGLISCLYMRRWLCQHMRTGIATTLRQLIMGWSLEAPVAQQPYFIAVMLVSYTTSILLICMECNKWMWQLACGGTQAVTLFAGISAPNRPSGVQASSRIAVTQTQTHTHSTLQGQKAADTP